MSVDHGGSAQSSKDGGTDPGEARPATPRKVLLAEDNAANSKLAIAMLGKLGYAVDAAANGVEAVEAWCRFSYDAVLMDCRMPQMDGFRATAEIRKQETSSARIPIIAMTADAMEGDRLKCLQAGMDDYVSKPVSFETLAAVLERWIPPADPRPKARVLTRQSSAGRNVGREQESSLDEEVIAGLRELERGRGKDRMSVLVSVFLQDAESNLERLRRGVEEEDEQTIVNTSHTLAGSAATFGARRMAELCAHLKTLVSRGGPEAVRENLVGIETEFARARTALRAEFPGSGEAGN